MASLNGMARRRQTASVGLYNELIAQAEFAKDPNKIVFVPAMGKGPIDMVVLDIATGEYKAYDVKESNYRKVKKTMIYRGLTAEQKKLKVQIYYNK